MDQSMTPQPRTPDQVMAFVSKASEQQLKAMVDAHDPYSFMALAQLQEIRDGKLKAQANQQKPPPLTQTIPQQVDEQGQKDAQMQLDSLSGIASLGQQPGQQPAQQPMQQAAHGGIIHLAHGGAIQHFANQGEVQGAVPFGLTDQDRQTIASLSPNEAQAYANARLAGQRHQAFGQLPLNGNGQRIDPLTGNPTDLATWMAPFTQQTPAPASAAPQTAAPTAAPQTAAPTAAPQTAAPAPIPAANTGIPTVDRARAAPGAVAEPSETNGLPSGFGPADFNKGLKNIGRLQDTAAEGQKEYIGTLERISHGLAFDPEEYKKASGDVRGETETAFKRRSEDFGDPYEANREHNKALLAETEKMEQNSKPKAMLQAAFSMLSDTSGNFFTAIGKAGGAGLAAYEKSQAYVQQEKRKNLEADARLAQAQDLRKRGMYKDAEEEAKSAKADRMAAYTAAVNGNIQQSEAAIRIAGERAKVSQQQVENAVVDFKNRAAIAQVFHRQPNQAIELANFYHNHPEYKREAQDAEIALKAGDARLRINSEWDRLLDAYNKSGQTLPNETEWKDQQMESWHKAIRDSRDRAEKAKSPVAVMPGA